MDTLKIGHYIQHLRKSAGMTQKELAAKLNISFQAVSKWENGETLPDMENMIALAKLYNTSLDELVGLTADNPKNQNTPENSINTAENTTEDKNANGKNNNTAKRQTISIFRSVPYPIIVAAIFLFIGSITHEWHVAWILFVTIPIYYSVLECISARRLSHFAYPVLATTIYLYCGMKFGIWHPTWILFTTIPIYYPIANEIDKSIAKKRNRK